MVTPNKNRTQILSQESLDGHHFTAILPRDSRLLYTFKTVRWNTYVSHFPLRHGAVYLTGYCGDISLSITVRTRNMVRFNGLDRRLCTLEQSSLSRLRPGGKDPPLLALRNRSESPGLGSINLHEALILWTRL